MNDTDRLRFVETIQRLQNWMTRTRLTPSEFLSVGSNRELFDELVQPVVAPLASKPAQRPRRRRPWRQWGDLPTQEQDGLLRQMARRRAIYRANHSDGDGERAQSYLARRRIVTNAHIYIPHLSQYLGYKVPTFASFPSHWIKNHRPVALPEGTPAERIHRRRSQYLSTLIYPIQLKEADVAFVKECHPDDIEFDSEHVVAAENLMQLQTLFMSSEGTEEKPLAATLFLTDPTTSVQVYYCALLCHHRHHRSGPLTLERAYLGRAFNLAEQRWLTTARFKRASNALVAALKIYGEGVAARIQPSTGEGALK